MPGQAPPPVFTYPALWSVQWAQAETMVTAAPAGALAATVTVILGQAVSTLGPPPPEVLYPSPSG